jgi:preprotein translocase subunit YajC
VAQWLLLCAEAAPGAGGAGFSDMLMLIVLMGVAFYFLIIRPQRREQAERQKMLNALAKGDRVITSAGIHGRVTDISKNGEMVTVECGKNIHLDFTRGSIASVVKKSGDSTEAAPAKAEAEEADSAKGKKGK